MLNAPVFADGLDDIAQEFLVESYENLDELDRALVALEKEPNSRPLLASIFRTIHTIKGTSGFLAFTRLEAVTHVGENVLSKLRDGHLELTPEITTVLLRMVDTVRALLGTIELTGIEGDVDTAEVVTETTESTDAVSSVETVRTPDHTEVHEVSQTRTVLDTVEHKAPEHDVHVVELHETVRTVDAVGPAEPDAGPEQVVHVAHTAVHAAGTHGQNVDGQAANGQAANGQSVNGQSAHWSSGRKAGAHADAAASTLAADIEADDQGDDDGSRRSVADSSIRVDVGVLDQLMRMVGELVLTRNQVVQYVGDLQHAELREGGEEGRELARAGLEGGRQN
jgi:two-component system chemotaxis sensor kinase CheA